MGGCLGWAVGVSVISGGGRGGGGASGGGARCGAGGRRRRRGAGTRSARRCTTPPPTRARAASTRSSRAAAAAAAAGAAAARKEATRCSRCGGSWRFRAASRATCACRGCRRGWTRRSCLMRWSSAQGGGAQGVMRVPVPGWSHSGVGIMVVLFSPPSPRIFVLLPARSAPASLALSYGGAPQGLDYDRAATGMQLADCRCLARALARTETLVHLDLCAGRGQGGAAHSCAPRVLDPHPPHPCPLCPAAARATASTTTRR